MIYPTLEEALLKAEKVNFVPVALETLADMETPSVYLNGLMKPVRIVFCWTVLREEKNGPLFLYWQRSIAHCPDRRRFGHDSLPGRQCRASGR